VAGDEDKERGMQGALKKKEIESGVYLADSLPFF
jgi:hypothetical protein